MKLGLDTIASLGANGDNKSDVLKALFAIKSRNSVLGTYGFDENGDTTLKSYGLYKVGSTGDPVFFKTLTPTQTVHWSIDSTRGGRSRSALRRRPRSGVAAPRPPDMLLSSQTPPADRWQADRSSPTPPVPVRWRGRWRSVRRYVGRWGLIVALAALPIYYGDPRSPHGYQAGFVAGHPIIHHDLSASSGFNFATGLSNGAIWALIAIGYTLVYGIIELINFAHGDVFMIGSFTAVGLYTMFGLSPAPARWGSCSGCC